MMQKMVREFAEKRVAPGAHERDEAEQFDSGLYNELTELGVSGICFPEEYGGAGGDILSYILAVEELSRADDGVGVSLSASVSLCAWPIYAYGTEAQKKKYLVPLCEGTHLEN
ncbi:MAG: Acyl-CoA dehydrogenase, short-chain specific [Anaerosporomusa subterranea]|jgi:alkylation response protein AidB-like acyl-CoA dehydrogenase|nr:Acyl-CoA dehydrogenase, short-chain specific [Anaerosporomusa subterranea]